MKDRIWKTASEKTADDLKEEYIDGFMRRMRFVETVPNGWYLDKAQYKAYEYGKITGIMETKFEEMVRLMGAKKAQKAHSDAVRRWSEGEDPEDKEEV